MDQVSFKVSLTGKHEAAKSQVRRFEVPQDCSTSYIYLKEKLRSLFGQELGHSGINITWEDQDNDIVTIESDEELLIAMQEMKGPVYKFDIVPSKASSGNESSEQESHHKVGELHPGVICDGCQGQVSGFRYKCMTCFDYDLCETCEYQGVHPGHNMMRIATPESTWPRHFINRLNKMQNRASKCNEQSRNQADTCRWPRGTRCPRDFGRGTGCPRGFGGGIKSGGCKVVPPPFCWITNQQYCNSADSEAKNSEESNSKRSRTDESYGAQSPLNNLLNVGEVMKATEAAVRTALESAKLNSKDSKDSDFKKDSTNNSESANAMNDFDNFGEMMRGVLSSLGIELDVDSRKNSDSNRQNTNGNSMNSKNKENSEDSSQVAQEHDSEKSETGTKPKSRTIPILEENRQINENSSEVQGVPEINSEEKQGVPEYMEETVMPLSPKIQVALQAMENMGFNNDDGWLSDLLMKYDGDIGKVLDLINKRN